MLFCEKKQGSLLLKRVFHLTAEVFVWILTEIPMSVIAVLIKLDSQGLCFTDRSG